MLEDPWLVRAAIATAFFTGGTLLISWLVYRQSRVETARSRPIQLSAIREGPELDSARENWQSIFYVHEKAIKEVQFHVYNRSAVPQQLTVINFSILWPRNSRWVLIDQGLNFSVEPFGGGNIRLRVQHLDWSEMEGNEIEEAQRQHTRTRYLARIKLSAIDGQRYSLTRRLTFYAHRFEGTIRIDVNDSETPEHEPGAR